MLKKLLVLLLAVCMVTSMLPMTVMAEVVANSDDSSSVSANTVATIGETEYETFGNAITAANALTGDVTVNIYGKVEYSSSTASLTGAYDSISFVGKTTDAEISITRDGSGGYISGEGNDCTVNFTDLILSKPTGAYANDAGFMNVYFTVYRVGAVNYTNCTFPDGACAQGCPVTYTDCEFANQTSGEYSLWVYASTTVTVKDSQFTGVRGVKMYGEGAAKTGNLVMSNTTFAESVTQKPAIVLTYGESVTLDDNTYPAKGVFELDKDGDPNGTTVTSTDTITCVNDDGDCGVLVDGKIYTTVAQAAEVATSGSTVTLLYSTTEAVELPEGVTLDKNGNTAENVTVAPHVATGTVTPAYTSPNRIWGEAGGNATESLVIKLFSGETEVGSASLNNINGIIDGDVYVTWGIYLDGTTDTYWNMTWAEGHPNVNSLPTEVVLYVDGVEVATNNYQLNRADSLDKIYAATTDENGKISAFYTSLANAVAAGGNITLLRDVEEAVTIESGKTVTIDLNGYTLSSAVTTITNNGTLTVKDSSAAKTGTVKTTGGANRAVIVNNIGGVATIESGNYIAERKTTTEWADNWYTIVNHGTMTINGGSISVNSDYTALIENGWQNTATENPTNADAKLTINGGSFTGGNYNIKVDDRGYLTVNGGTFTCNKSSNILVWNQVTITGGTFISANIGVWGGQSGVEGVGDGLVTITGGDFTQTNAAVVAYVSADVPGFNAATAVSGGAYSDTSAADYLVKGYSLAYNTATGTYGVEVLASAQVAQVGTKRYTSLQAAVDAADGTKSIYVIGNISDEAVTVDKSLTITADDDVTLNNVSITGSKGIDLTVSNLNFTGNSWINSNGAAKLTVSGVTANVTPNNGSATNSRSAFIALGASEQVKLELVVENSAIVANGGADPVLGWAQITKATITGNTFGSSEAYQENSDSVKFMSIADGAVITVTGNTVYSNYNGFVFYQNTSRDNAYTVIVEKNVFNGTGDMIWVEVGGSTTTKATVKATSDNTVNGETFTAADIKASSKITTWTSYAGVDVKTDDNGKVIGGTLAFHGEDTIAENYVVAANGEVTPDPYAIFDLDDLKAFRDAVNAGDTCTGETWYLVNDIDLNGEEWTPIGTGSNGFRGTFDGKKHTISNLVITGNSSTVGLFANTYNGEIKNLTVENAKVSGYLNVGVVAGNPYTSKYTNITVTGHVEVNGMAYVGGVGGKSAYANWTDITVDADATSYVKATSTENGITYRTYVGGVIGFMGEGNVIFENIESNIKVIGDVCDIGGITGIAHYSNTFENVTCTGAVVNTSTDAAAGAETGGIAGTWNNQAGKTVTMTNCKFEGTVTVNNVDVTKTNGLSGAAYNAQNDTADNSGSLIVDGVEAWLKVAQVGETKYTTLQAAVDAAQSGDTITLIGNVSEAITIAEGAKIVLDLNNYTLNGSVLAPNATLTIKNGSIANTDTSASALEINAGKLVLENVNIDSARHAVRIDGAVEATINGGTYRGAIGTGTGTYHAVNVSGAANVTIKSGTFVGPKGTTADSGSAVNVQSGATVAIEGGSFSGGKNNTLAAAGTLTITGGTYDQDPTAYVAKGYEAVENEDGTWAVKKKPVATVTDTEGAVTYYTTLADAFAAAKNGDTVTLLNDAELSETLTIPAELTVTLDLNGKAITVKESDGNHIYALNNLGVLTIKDSVGGGSITARGILNGYNGEDYDEAAEGAKLIIDGGKFVGMDDNGGAAIFNSAELIINDGTFEGERAALSNRMMGEAVINGGTFNGGKAGYTIQNYGNLTIEDATVKGVMGAVATYEGPNNEEEQIVSTVVINGGTYSFTGIQDTQTYCVHNQLGSITINGGTFQRTGDVKLNEVEASIIRAEESVTITGGMFYGVYGAGTEKGLFSGDKAVVSGGTYDQDPTAYVAEGYCVTSANNVYTVAKAVAQIGDDKYESFAAALEAVNDGETIELKNISGDAEKGVEIEFTKDIEFTITGEAPNYALPTVTFQNATVNIKDATILIPELDARQNATINVIDSTVYDVGGNSIVKSYYNGAINISGTSKVYTMQVTTMGYITISDTAELHAVWQTNVYGNGLITVEDSAVFATAALQLTGKDYSGRDNTDADRVGKPATVVVDGATLTVGKVYSSSGADYSYNSSYGINIGTVDGKNAVLDIKNGATVNIYMANGETANIGANGTVNVAASTLNVACRKADGTVTVANNGTVNVSGASDIAATVTGSGWVYMNGVTLDADTKLIGAKVRFASGTNNIDGSTIDDGFFQVGIGVYNGVDANVDTVNGVVVNVKNAVIGSSGSTYAGWVGTGYYDTDAEKAAAMTNAKYVLNIENSVAEFGYLHVSNDGELNVTGNAATKVKYNNSEYSFRAGDFIINGVATFDATDVLAFYTKVSCDNGTDKPGTLNIVNGTEYEVEPHNGGTTGNTLTLYKTGVVNVEDATLYVGDATNIAADAVLNIGGTVTAIGTVTNNGTINLTKSNAALTAADGLTVKSGVEDYKVVYENGSYKLIAMVYVAQINGGTKYESLAAALAAAKTGDTIDLLGNSLTDVSGFSLNGITLKNGSITFQKGARIGVGGDVVLDNVDLTFDMEGTSGYSNVAIYVGNGKTASLTLKNESNILIKNPGYTAVYNDSADAYPLNIDNSTLTIEGKGSQTGINSANITLTNGAKLNTSNTGIAVNSGSVNVDGTSAVTVNGTSSHGITNVVLTVAAGGVVDVDDCAYLGLNIQSGSSIAEGAKVTVDNCGTGGNYVGISARIQGTVTGYENILVEDQKIVATAGANGNAFTSLEAALEAANDGETVTLLADISASEIITIDKGITLDGGNFTITSTAGRAINIDTTAEVTIKNLTIVGGTGCQRGINIINQAGTTNLDNVTISGISHYAVHVATAAGAVKVNINESELTGYAALAIYGAGTTATVTDSKLVGINPYEDNGSNGFATIVVSGTNATLTVTGGSVTAEATEGKAPQAVIGANAGTEGIEVVLDTDLITKGTATFASFEPDGNTVSVRSEYADELNAEGWATEASATDGLVTIKGIAVAKVGDTYYTTFDAALSAVATSESKTLTMLADAEVEMLVLKPGVKLDLNGNVLTVEMAIVSFGDIVDSADGVGGIKISNDPTVASTSLQAANSYMPIYDGECYRFYSYTVALAAKSEIAGDTAKDKAQFGIRLTFTNADAYTALANNGSDFEIAMNIDWGTGSVRHVFSADSVKTYAEKAATQSVDGGTVTTALVVTVSGLQTLGVGTEVSATAAIESTTGMTADMAEVSVTVQQSTTETTQTVE